MSFADRAIKDKVQPVPREAVAHVAGHERALLEEELRAFARMRSHEQTLLQRTAPGIAEGPIKPPKPKITTDMSQVRRARQQQHASSTASPKSAKLQPIVHDHASEDSPSARIGAYYSPVWNGITLASNNNHNHSGQAAVSALPSNKEEQSPATVIPMAGVKKSAFLPLEIFDDVSLEQRPDLISWVGSFGHSIWFDGKDYVWKRCKCIGFNATESTFLIEWCDDPSKTKYVRRLNVRFDAEDETSFLERRAAALGRRQDYEARIRLQMYLQDMPPETVSDLDEEMVDRILALVAAEFPVAQIPFIERAIDEAREHHALALKRTVFEYRFMAQAERERLAHLALPAPDPLPPTPEFGTVPIPSFDMSFTAARNYILENLFSVHPALIPTMTGLFRNWGENYASRSLVDAVMEKLDRPSSLDAFLEAQRQHVSRSATKLKVEWVPNTAWMIQNNLDETPGFHFYMDSMEQYAGSTMQRFLKCSNLIMSEQLRSLTKTSMADYVSLLCTQPFEPIVSVRLVVREKALVYEPPLSSVHEQLMAHFETVVLATHSIPRLGANCLPLLDFPPEEYLDSVELSHPIATELREKLSVNLQESYMPLDAMRTELEGRFSPLWLQDVDELVAQSDEASALQHLTTFRNMLNDAADNVRRFNAFGVFSVDAGELRKLIRVRAEQFMSALLTKIFSTYNALCSEIETSYSEIYARLDVKPTNAEELVQLQSYYADCGPRFAQLQNQISHARQIADSLETFSVPLPSAEFEALWSVIAWPAKCARAMDDCKMQIEDDRRRFMEELREAQERFLDELERHREEAEAFATYGDLEQVFEIQEKVEKLSAKIAAARETSRLYNAREKIFEWQETAYPQINDVAKTFEPFRDLWTVASSWAKSCPEWYEGQFTLLDGEQIEQDVNSWWRTLFKASKSMTERSPAAAGVAQTLRERVEQFRAYIPLIQALRNPGLRDRHWERISDVCGHSLYPSEEMTLNGLLALDLMAHIDKIQEISDVASKEYKLEKALEKMQTEWKPMAFECAPWRETGTHIVKGVDDIQNLLDDHIVKTQSMRGDPNIKAIEKRVRDWEEKLKLTQDVLDEWLKCQGVWLYLEPIFSSDDISRQLPVEAKRFEKVDAVWRKTMELTCKTPAVLTATAIENLLPTFIEANRLLDMIQKGLNDYLETKRLAFPRFFFLSNDELLEILSETKDPLRVQPHLRKCFESINSLEFQPNMDITAMYSSENEKVGFIRKINPADAGGNVEKWLLEVEKVMVDSLKDIMKKSASARAAIADDAAFDRWVVAWPGQIVLAASCWSWTRNVEEALQKGGVKQLAKFEKVMNTLMETLIKLVRGDLSSLARATLSALVVIEVHNRDTVTEMVRNKVSDINAFDWLAQLRYYFDEAGALIVRQTNAALKYGYEYLGNSARLVITPLTDRCYRTLMGALHLHLGGAPEGPAGTGKTETTKDLAKAIAKQCVVFNCSDGLDYLAMGKFFKGLASSGAWSCFDEFNRIDLEVLSVIAQQILTIQRAIAMHLQRFVFEGTELALDASCAVFITMNPGYAGRSELPDNLKALFRPVAMMVPNYALIAEISLFSYGFLKGRSLAEKIVATYKLCSEQLSSQDHYDYGMRAVKSVLTAAGNLKRKYADEEEDILVLRAIQDVNLPKFLSHDIPLFNGIISDLFPGVSLPEIDRQALFDAMHASCASRNLQPQATFLDKVVQLYEMIIVRHGLMVVGYSYAGKTCAIRVLADALTSMSKQGLERATHLHTLNPKSITMGQLYGSFDLVSHEWTDGILANMFRECSSDPSPDRKWIIFDGPVDAVWIESMNTVLDDNKKLCLVSGEIIQMSNTMNLIFEVQDLAVASPATVSRCGMVYMEPHSLGWQPLLTSWLATLPSHIPDTLKTHISSLFHWMAQSALDFRRKRCKEYVNQSEIMGVASLLRLYDSLLDDVKTQEKFDRMSERDRLVQVENTFLFSLVWCIGGTTEDSTRAGFNTFARDMFASANPKEPTQKLQMPIPDKGAVFDYVFKSEELRWVPWLDTVEQAKIPRDASFNSIIVTTIDTIRYSFLAETLLTHNHPVLFVGPTGTGKTIYVKDTLEKLDSDKYVPIFVNFSAQTSANQTQDLIDGKLDKRRKGVYGPPLGKRALVFVDDLNMPQLEVYGAQPPIELIRQWMDHKGWYDRKEKTFKHIVDMQYVCAMGPPGGGRNAVTPRLIRHFCMFALNEFDDDTMTRIFSTLMDWFLEPFQMMPVKSLRAPVVAGTIALYRAISKELLPTPSRPHYVFNLRDLSKVFQGVSMVRPERIEGPEQFIRLWYHECQRVFQDRLIDDGDRSWFDRQMNTVLKEQFKSSLDSAVPDRQLIFTDFRESDADNRKYEEIKDVPALNKIMVEYLDEYNAMSAKRMNLVLFRFAISHVARIARILRQPRGNALLIGVGGSGRQSLTRLAAHIMQFEVSQVEISKNYTRTEWREDLKLMLKRAGGSEGKYTVFLFTDTQIKYESFLEDISNILNTGEVPNLFPNDELSQILEGLRNAARDAAWKDMSRAGLYNFFVERSRERLHVVLCMSPVGDALRNRLRQFPSLVNCCTIDWFTQWPDEALSSVANSFLEDIDATETVRDACVKMCVYMHQSVHELSKQYLTEAKRYNYVTPTSYLELISTFKTLLGKRQTAINELRRRYDVGLQKLASAESQVTKMQGELTALKPVLIQTTKEVEDLMVVIERESKDAAATKEVVQKDENEANAKAAISQKLKDECEADLAEAIPALEAATRALKSLTKKDITEVKAMANPPQGVRVVMEAVCIMNQIKPIKKDDGKGKKVDDFWDPAKKMMANPNFLQSLMDYDKDNIPDVVIRDLQPYLKDPEFVPEVIERVSLAAKGLCAWVRAMDTYNRIVKVVAPKRAALAQAEAELAKVMAVLNEKKAALKKVVDKIDNLNSEFEQSKAKKDDLARQVKDCENKLDRAQRLIGGLGGEKSRWTTISADLAARYTNVTGDVLISSGLIAYLGAFTSQYRTQCIDQWKVQLKEAHIPCSDVFSLSAVLGDPVKIREWNICGLPADSFSVDNGIVVSNARRWPLLIDPQGQANKWIKSMEKDNKLMVMKLTDEGFLRSLENCIQFGTPVLLENVGEELDPVLEPLLLKQVFKSQGTMCIRLGDNTIEYSKDFRFYITTKMRNPHYLPELSTKVTLINFMITPDGLEDQLLGIVVAKERPELEREKNELVIQSAENKRALKEIEDKILELLSSSTGDLLENEAVVNALSKAKITANEIAEKQAAAEITEAEIDATRLGYKPVALRSSLLFFCISELANVDPMYQYSLAWFIALYIRGIQEAPPSESPSKRLENLKDFFTYSLYKNVCRSLFENHKLLFSFIMCVKIQDGEQGAIREEEWRFLLTGGIGVGGGVQPANPASAWLIDKSWDEMLRLDALPAMKGVVAFFTKHMTSFKAMYDSPEPQRFADKLRSLPTENGFSLEKMSGMHWLLLLRVVRPDKVTSGVQDYVERYMDRRFVDPPVFDLPGSYADSAATTPLIFVLSPGADPMTALIKFAEGRGFAKKLEALSLGQGQGPIAERKIKEACQRGTWVVLQNCHLAVSWMPTLEKIVEELDPASVNPDFRMILTSMPSEKFPTAVLQNSVKVTNEPPRGLRANLLRSFVSDPVSDPEFFGGCTKDTEFKRMAFALCFFHAVIQERRKFGPLGWNIPYEFTESDLRISIRQLQMFLNEYKDIPFAALLYLTGECNYGGRVTDDWDRRLLNTYNADYYCKEVVEKDQFALSESGTYVIPNFTKYDEFIEFIRGLPLEQKPEVFGLHENADITKDLNETQQLFSAILSTQGSSSSSSSKQKDNGAAKQDAQPAKKQSKDDVVGDIAKDILSRLPMLFDIEEAQKKYPVSYEESMNTVLVQEMIRFNRLLEVVRKSLVELQKAIKGIVVMSSELDALSTAMYTGTLPKMWAAKSYPSRKPFGAYVADFMARLKFLQDWMDQGPPPVFWISGFFFTQSFLTGVLQNYARRYRIPIDAVAFDFEMMTYDEPTTKPEDGCYIKGMFLEGARWDAEKKVLADSYPKVLFSAVPIMWLRPMRTSEIRDKPHFPTACYRESSRRGVLSTTGHSTNYVMTFKLPSADPVKKWVKRGCALLLQLDN